MDSELNGFRNLKVSSLNEDEGFEVSALEKQPAEEFYDDCENEEDGLAQVTLGFVEKAKTPTHLLRHFFPSKAGGVPAWLDPVNLPSEKTFKCGFCGDPLQFLLQIYAPISEKESAFHRMLFVFICPSMSCLLRDQHEQWKCKKGSHCRSIKVLRCQLPRKNPFYSSNPPMDDGSIKPLVPGAVLCSWCSTWKGDKLCSGCKRMRYCSEKHQVLHWRAGHKTDCPQLISYCGSPAPVLQVPTKSAWPEYEIAIESEHSFDSETAEGDTFTNAPVHQRCNEDESMESLMEEFEADADKKCWVEFQERIARAPEQILRYCRSSMVKPLWPLSVGHPSNIDIPSCVYCRGQLCYEFQIMPQLLYYFGVKNEPDSLDWATIVVYTCQASCELDISYKEEFAWVQLYPSAVHPEHSLR